MFQRMKIGNRGFSIIEAMVAVVVLSIIFIPITNTFIDSIKASQEAKNMQEATETAQKYMEECTAESFLELYDKYHYASSPTRDEVKNDTWPDDKLVLQKLITRNENDCCDLTVDIQISKKSTVTDTTNGLEDINKFEVPKLYSMDSSSSHIVDIGETPSWILYELSDKYSETVDVVRTHMTRVIELTLTKDAVTGNTRVVCAVEYWYGGSKYKTLTMDDTTLTTELKNLYLYYTADYDGEIDTLRFQNSEQLTGNFYVIGDGRDDSVANFELVGDGCSYLNRFHVVTSVPISGVVSYSVSSQGEYIPDKEKETRRYEVIVTVTKTGSGKVYSQMVSTRGE